MVIVVAVDFYRANFVDCLLWQQICVHNWFSFISLSRALSIRHDEIEVGILKFLLAVFKACKHVEPAF